MAATSHSQSVREVTPPLQSASPTLRMKTFIKSNAGFLLIGASQAFFALMDLSVKKLNKLDPPVPTLELVTVRMGITYIFCIVYLLWKKIPEPFLGPKEVRLLLVVRGLCGFIGLASLYYSLKYLSLSDATVLFFLAPIGTAISGYYFLGEVFPRREAVAGGVIGATGAYTAIRAAGIRAHTLHSMAYFSMIATVASAAGMVVFQQTFVIPTRVEWLAMLILIGIFGFLAQVLLTMGLQRGAAGRGAMAIYIQIVFALILERIFFGTTPPLLSFAGIFIILGSAIYITMMRQSAVSPKADVKTNGDIARDLETGAAESETQTLLSHESASYLSTERR